MGLEQFAIVLLSQSGATFLSESEKVNKLRTWPCVKCSRFTRYFNNDRLTDLRNRTNIESKILAGTNT